MSNHHLKMVEERRPLARYSLSYLLSSVSIFIIFKTAVGNGWKSRLGVHQKTKKPHISVIPLGFTPSVKINVCNILESL